MGLGDLFSFNATSRSGALPALVSVSEGFSGSVSKTGNSVSALFSNALGSTSVSSVFLSVSVLAGGKITSPAFIPLYGIPRADSSGIGSM